MFLNVFLLCILVINSCAEGDLMLIGERDNFSGQVFFCSDMKWLAVCDDFWNENKARVVCRQLGFPNDGDFL